MKKLLSAITFCLLAIAGSTQNVGIGTPTPNPRAILDLTSTNKGFLLPRVVLQGATDNITIPNPPYGLMVINLSELEGEGPGIYLQTGMPAAPLWRRLGLASGGWALQGNSGASGAVLGHLDNMPLQFIVGGSHVARLGGNSNILFGLNSGTALPQTVDFNSYNNIAIGNNTMATATTGAFNIAIGNGAMNEANGGITGIAIGGSALNKQSVGASENIAIGFSSQAATTSGGNNISIGRQSLFRNTTGSNNLAIGVDALSQNIGGGNNIAIGNNAGQNETSSDKLYIENSNANKNNALIYGDFAGDSLLLNAKTINRNSFNIRGANALELGYGASNKQTDAGKICYGCFGDPAHWLGIVGGGTQANAGSDRVIKLWSEGGLRIRGNTIPDFASTYMLGTNANPWRSVTSDSARSNAYMLRNSKMHIVGADDELIFKNNNFDIAKVTSGGISPAADNDVYLGSPSRRFVAVYATIGVIQTSDANLKTNIHSSPYGLDEVMQMNPVQYNWKTNPTEDLQIGFLAQDIQKIIPEAVVVPENGDPLGMKYSELIPVLVKAIQQQQQRIDELEKQVKKMKH